MAIETFISYARKDGLTHAEHLERALPNTWRDKRNLDPFKDFTAEIERAIDACRQVVAVITPDTTRDDSFVRRELAYAEYRKKPIIIVRFVDVPPPLNVFNHTWLDWFKLGWDETLDQIRAWMRTFVPTYHPPALADALAADPHREYLGALYDSIVDYLDRVIIKEVTLKTKHTAGAVAKSKPALLGGFYRRAGLNASEESIETLQEGLEHFKGRLLLLGEPGAGKTISVLATARDAVVRRLNDPAAPLPILLRCAEWTSDPPMPLSDWVQEQVGLTMTTFSDAFVFFDGFDELGTSRIRRVRDEKGKEYDESYDPRPLFLDIIPKVGRVLLSCRIKEYEDFGTKVDLNGAVTLRPLTDTQIHEYLADMPDLWNVLSSDAELLEVLRTPLLLSLFAFGYKDAPYTAKALQDLNAAELNEAIFKQYVHKRYEHEALRFEDMNQTPPFKLDEVYEVLGQVAMINASGGWSVKDNILPYEDFEVFIDKIFTQEFVGFVNLLNLIAPIDDSLRFIHLRLRDHFVRAYCYLHVGDAEYYTSMFGPNPAKALASLPNAEAVDALTAQLSHSDIEVRKKIVEVLGEIGDIHTLESLVVVLKDNNWNVRYSTMMALEGIVNRLQPFEHTRVIEFFINTLKDTDMRQSAASALGRLGDKRAVEPLTFILNDTNADVSYSAIEALGKIGDVRALQPLIAMLEHTDKDVRRSTIVALGKIADIRAVKSLISALEDQYMRRIAIQSLGEIADLSAFESLITLLHDKDVDIRRCTVEAISKIGDARAVKPLVATLEDEHPYVRDAAQEALTRIGTSEALAALEEWRKRRRGE